MKDGEAAGCVTLAVDCVICAQHLRESAHSCVYFGKS